MWIDLCLLVHKVNATLKKEVEEIPMFLVKMMCQVHGQC